MSGTTATAKTEPEPETAAPKTDPLPDLDVIVPASGTTIFAGVEVEVRRIKTRELLALMQVLIVGAGPSLHMLSNLSEDDETRQGEVLALVLLALPQGVDEFLTFLSKLLYVAGAEDRKVVAEALDNPELDDLIEVATVIVAQEWEDLDSLLGKTQRLVKVVTKLKLGR